MKKIEFVGGISEELCEIIEANNLNIICVDSNICILSDIDLIHLQSLTPEAFVGNDIIIID